VADKLRVLVRVDVSGAQAKVETEGHVTVQSVQGLYDVMKRATSLMAGLALELDMTHAQIEPDALEQLHACSQSCHPPPHIDPLQSDYRISILMPSHSGPCVASPTLAA
jgi:hypothetical protein